MARTKAFDEEVALERAMHFFWAKGYEAASLRDLLEAMQIGRQSLYDTFGDKHRLFLASLERYYAMGIETVVSRLEAPDGGLGAIEHYFESMARQLTTPPHRSCMLVNSASELAPHDPEVSAIVNRFMNKLQKGFAKALRVAIRQGEARVEDPEATAWQLTSSAMGLGTMSKARIPYKNLKRVAEQITVSLRA